MSVNRNHWRAKPYQFAFVTTVLVARGKAKVNPLFEFLWTMKQNVKKIGVCYTSHGTLAVCGNDKARKRVRHEEDLLVSSQPAVGYCLQASLITVLPVCCAV